MSVGTRASIGTGATSQRAPGMVGAGMCHSSQRPECQIRTQREEARRRPDSPGSQEETGGSTEFPRAGAASRDV